MSIYSKQFVDTRTGEIVTQIPIMEIKYFEEVTPEMLALAADARAQRILDDSAKLLEKAND